MSVTISYVFNSEHELPELRDKFCTWLGMRLEPYDGDATDLFCRWLGMELTLCRHDLGTDRDLDFESYTYELESRTSWGDAEYRSIQLAAMALLAHSIYLRFGVVGMLVYDVQVMLAKYVDRQGMYDLISEQHVTYPKHLTDLAARLPDRS